MTISRNGLAAIVAAFYAKDLPQINYSNYGWSEFITVQLTFAFMFFIVRDFIKEEPCKVAE